MQQRSRKRGITKRGNSEDDSNALWAGMQHYEATVLPLQLLGNDATVLVSPDHDCNELVDMLSAKVRIRMADDLPKGVSMLFPATGICCVVLCPFVHKGTSSDLQGVEDGIAAILNRDGLFRRAKERVLTLASRFARVEVVVVNDLELSKFIFSHTASLGNVACAACHGTNEAAERLLQLLNLQRLYKSATQQEVRTQYQLQCINAIAAHPITRQRVWLGLGVHEAAAASLNGEDLELALSGRASVSICEEHFGWSPQLAASLANTLINDVRLGEQ